MDRGRGNVREQGAQYAIRWMETARPGGLHAGGRSDRVRSASRSRPGEPLNQRRKAVLALADGTTFVGRAFGAEVESVGEVVFNTSMTGYQEILTDPSYVGQIVTFTYPEI